MVSLKFDWRDIFRSTRIAFSFQRLWIQFIGLFSGYLGYVILTYLCLVVSGEKFSVIWARYGLIPGISGYSIVWYGWIIYALGVFILLFAWLVTATGVSRATYMNLKGNTFYTWKESLMFALKKKGGAVISTPIAIIAIIFFTSLGGVVVGLLGRWIPFLGELGISLLAPVWFIASLFLVFVVLALCVSLLLTPAILATTDDDAFEGIFQSFSTLYSQPWRLIFYELLIIINSVVGFGIFAFFAKKAWGVMTTILIWGMGAKYANLSYAASYLLQNWIYPVYAWAKALLGDYAPYIFFSHDFTSIELPVVMTVSSWIFGIFLIIIGGFIVSFPCAILNVGHTLVFLILKKKKDDENLLERKDKEEEEEEEEEEEKPAEEEPKEEVKKKKEKKKKEEKKKTK
jgi:Sec-independent protein translocase protein TatA